MTATAPALPTRFARLVKIEHTVFALAVGDAVGDGENGRSHGRGSFVFSTSWTSPMTMSLSIALAMS